MSGVALEAHEYRRWDWAGGATPWQHRLRLPGQYFDAETDLFENWNRFYDASLGRYLSPEPLLSEPEYLGGSTQAGYVAPFYAYVNHNPIFFNDPTGLRFKSLTRRERAAIDRLRLLPGIGDDIKYLDDTDDIEIDLIDTPLPTEGGRTTWSRGRPGGGCSGARPARGIVRYDVKSAAALARSLGLTDTWLDNVLAHELGHLFGEWHDGLSGAASDVKAVDWENVSRQHSDSQAPGVLRPRH